MKSKIILSLLLLLSTGLVAGCVQGAPDTLDLSTSTPTFTLPPTLTILPALPTQTETSVVTSIPSTPIATLTPTVTIVPYVQHQCLQVDESDSPETMFEGTLVLADEWFGSRAYLLYLEGEPQNPTPLWDEDRLFSLAVSPDRQWLAYLVLNREQKQQNLMVVSTQGEQLKSITMSLNFSKILEWLTDDRLAISRWRQDENGAQLLDSTVIFNPFTGEQWELVSDDYPGIYSSIRPIVHWLDRYYNRTVYDPSLTRVIFAGLDEDGTPILLVDMRTKQVLGKISWKGYFYGTTPQWSPDGQQVLVSGPAQLNQIDSSQNGIELFSLTRDGQITRLTHLTDVYPALVYNFRWSPDGQKVAFWVDLQESTLSGVLLAVLDVASGEVVNYCIPGEKVDPYSDNYVPPVWSPDSQQIAVASVLDEEQLPVTIIVDLVQGVATKVVENLIPMGWMVSPP